MAIPPRQLQIQLHSCQTSVSLCSSAAHPSRGKLATEGVLCTTIINHYNHYMSRAFHKDLWKGCWFAGAQLGLRHAFRELRLIRYLLWYTSAMSSFNLHGWRDFPSSRLICSTHDHCENCSEKSRIWKWFSKEENFEGRFCKRSLIF